MGIKDLGASFLSIVISIIDESLVKKVLDYNSLMESPIATFK